MYSYSFMPAKKCTILWLDPMFMKSWQCLWRVDNVYEELTMFIKSWQCFSRVDNVSRTHVNLVVFVDRSRGQCSVCRQVTPAGFCKWHIIRTLHEPFFSFKFTLSFTCLDCNHCTPQWQYVQTCNKNKKFSAVNPKTYSRINMSVTRWLVES